MPLRVPRPGKRGVPRIWIRRWRRRGIEKVQPSVKRLLASWSGMPAFVRGRHLDVLAANPLATALSPMYTPGVNLLRALLLDPSVRDLYEDWEALLEGTVAGLRATAPQDDPHLTDLVLELSVKSDTFRRLWARKEAQPQPGSGTVRLRHPVVGRLELQYDHFTVAAARGQVLTVYQALPGTESDQALTLLAKTALAAD